MHTRSSNSEGSANPFLDEVYVTHPDILPGVPAIHHIAFNTVVDSIESLIGSSEHLTPADIIGRIILLTAPRAGYGKSHLSARLKKHLNASATTLTLPFDPSRPVSWPVALSSILRQFVNETAKPSSHQCLFAESGHFLLAQIILSHRKSGLLKEGQCPVDDEALRHEFSNLFTPESELLNWTDQQSRDLARRADPQFLNSLGLSAYELGFWTRLVIDFTVRGDAALGPLRGLSSGEARERLLQWLRIATFYRPNLIICDGLDGFFRSKTAGMEIAEILTGIRESVSRTITLIALNEEVWQSVFQEKLPTAWLDRLSGESEILDELSSESAAALVRFRLERTSITEAQSERFVNQLQKEHRWDDGSTPLCPRSVIRQARDLWARDSSLFLTPVLANDPGEEEELEPIANLTDKAEFFEALAEDRPLLEEKPSSSLFRPGEELFPTEEEKDDSETENPFFAPSPSASNPKLARIESIIEDIRGSGKTVVSELDPGSSPSTPPPTNLEAPFEAGQLKVQSSKDSETPTPWESSLPVPKPMAPPSVEKIDWSNRLKSRETELVSHPDLKLNLEEMAAFLRSIGAKHQGLSQEEERYPSSRTACLRWHVRGESVLIGFESPQNVYFWNNLLQRSLSNNRREKIAAFSHRSMPFNSTLFSSFGFSPAVTDNRIDVIELNDRELAMILAADSILKEAAGTGEESEVTQLVIRYLDPLWRQISRSI